MTASLYRKYRPQTFADVVGQDAIERTLRNALSQNKVSHAYLFCGPRGTGKTTTARLMAKALLCEKGITPDPDGTCDECRAIAEGTHPDVYELDAASRTGVENVREEIIGRVNFAPTRGRAKVYIIDEVHMLSTAAFNALLKTLEEPPEHVVFILCTTDPQKVPATIHSRCQRFDFHRLSVEQIVSRLGAVCVSEDVEFEPEALELIAARSEGGMRNALTALEQLIVFGENKVTLAGAESLLGSLDATDMAEVIEAIGSRDAVKCFDWTSRYMETGADMAQFSRDLAAHIRTLYVMSLAGTDAPIEVSDSERIQMERELAYFGPDRLGRILCVIGDLLVDLRTSSNPRLSFEIALTRMIHPKSDLTLESLAERVESLEKSRLSAPAAAPVAPAVAAQPVAPQPVAAPVPTPTPTPQPAAVPPAPVVAPKAEPAPQPVPPAKPAVQPKAPLAQEEPAPAPVAASGVNVDITNPAALQRAWQQAMVILKKEKAAHSVLFMNTLIEASPEGDAIVAAFPPVASFAFAAVQKPEAKQALAAAVRQAFGKEVPVRFVKQEGAAAPVASAAPVIAPAPSAPQPSSAPAAAPAAQPAPAPSAPFSAPVETVPYDDVVPYDDEPAPVEVDVAVPPVKPFDTRSASAAVAPSEAPIASPAVAEKMAAPAPYQAEAPSQAGSGDNDIQSIQDMLSDSMGGNIVFEEIDDDR